MEFEPENFKQMAGLICMYDPENYLYIHASHDEDLEKCISILRAENKSYTYPVGICCQDMTGFGKYCDFDFFEYSTEV